jgi:putative hemolysin
MDFLTLLIFVVILSLNAFFCAAETALTGVSESKLHTLADRGSRRARLLLRLLHQRSRVVAGLLVGQNIVGAVLAVYSTIVMNAVLDLPYPWLKALIAALLSIVLLLVFGEVIPKSLAVHAPTSAAMAFAWPVWLVSHAFRPITAVLSAVSGALIRIVGGSRSEPSLTVEEIQAIARMGLAAGAIDEFEGKVVAKAAMLNDIRVREIMIPRTDIQGIEVHSSLEDIRQLFQKTPYSRLPAYKGDLDDIVGILNFKEFLRHEPGAGRPFDVQAFLRKPLFVSESMFIGDLLNQMRERRTHLAIALDEYGGTSGLLTLEDVVEMLVGRIEDEYDIVSTPFQQIDETTWEVDGRVSDERLVQRLGLKLPPEALEGFDTAAGLALKAFGNIPSEGDATTYYGLEITATRVRGHRVHRLRVRTLPPEEIAALAEQAKSAPSTRRRTTRQIVPEEPEAGRKALDDFPSAAEGAEGAAERKQE